MIEWAVIFKVFISDLDEDADGRFIRFADDKAGRERWWGAAETLRVQKDFDKLTE